MLKLFIFGATGDLVRRKVLPALEVLNRTNPLQILALGRKHITSEEYHKIACKDYCSPEFLSNITYLPIDYESANVCVGCEPLFSKKEINYFYISLPPQSLPATLTYIGKVKKEGYKVQILCEKPFGNSFAHAKKLQRLLATHELTNNFLISDHYLFKDAILRLKERPFKKLTVRSIEGLGLEGRGYYDSVGALKDMVQNHFLNIAFKLCSPNELLTADVQKFVRGQYGNGTTSGYAAELGNSSSTSTFVWIRLVTKTRKEIEFITGKGFKTKEGTVQIDTTNYPLEKGQNPYVVLLNLFFKNKKNHFPTIAQSVTAWRIIEKLNAHKPALIFYPQGKSFEEIKPLFE